MVNIWPFNREQKKLENEGAERRLKEADDQRRWSFLDQKEMRFLLGCRERRAVYEWTDKLIFEFVPLNYSADPGFRDDFLFLSNKLQEIDHPGFIKLMDFGERNGRLYRAWERRFFYPVVFYPGRTALQEAEAFFPLLQALELLGQQVDPSLARFPLNLFSTESRGHFIARPPQTLKKWRTFFDDRDQDFSSVILFHQYAEEDPEQTPDLSYQFAMANLIWLQLAKAFPYTRPAIARFHNHTVERLDQDFGPNLGPVLYRLTDLDPEARYSTLQEAFSITREALQAYCEDLKRGSVKPLFEHRDGGCYRCA